MTHLLRGKQAGIQNDLSLGITPEQFMIDDVSAVSPCGNPVGHGS